MDPVSVPSRSNLLLVLAIAVAAVGLSACSPSVLALDVGTCFDDGDELGSVSEVRDVPIVDCDVPHDNEVYFTFQLNDGSYPGSERVFDIADKECFGSFEPYVDEAYETSQLEFGWLVPTEEAWEEANDREIICFLYDLGLNKLAGSMEGSGSSGA